MNKAVDEQMSKLEHALADTWRVGEAIRFMGMGMDMIDYHNDYWKNAGSQIRAAVEIMADLVQMINDKATDAYGELEKLLE